MCAQFKNIRIADACVGACQHALTCSRRAPQGPSAAAPLACELCQAHQAAAARHASLCSPADTEPCSLPASLGYVHSARGHSVPGCLARRAPAPSRRLRVLCLHGFRQTGGKLRGHWAGLIRRLGDMADFTFVDAPHALPLYYRGERPPAARLASCCEAVPSASCPRCAAPEAEPPAAGPACGGSGAQRLSMRAGGIGRGRGGEGAVGSGSSSGLLCEWHSTCRGAACVCACRAGHQHGAPPRSKRAWLVEAAAEGAAREGGDQGIGVRVLEWQPAPAALDAQQHLRQVEGWPASLALLRAALRGRDGPYDGVMGFSQVGHARTPAGVSRRLQCPCVEQVHVCRQCSCRHCPVHLRWTLCQRRSYAVVLVVPACAYRIVQCMLCVPRQCLSVHEFTREEPGMRGMRCLAAWVCCAS